MDETVSNADVLSNSTEFLSNSTSVAGPLSGLFDGIDFGFNSKSFHQLITALSAILIISTVIIIAIVLFRCYMLYFKNYSNTTVYQLPMYRRVIRNHNRPNRRRRKTFFWRSNNSLRDPNIRETYTFQAIFDDPQNEDQNEL